MRKRSEKEREADRECKRALYATPEGRASWLWRSMNQRVRVHPLYARVEIRLTREEFLSWAVPILSRWMKRYPSVSPSIDRVDPAGHYELANMRVISWEENRRRSERYRNLHAPTGMAWCCDHREYMPLSEFHRSGRSVRGVANRCVKCTSDRYARKHGKSGARRGYRHKES